VHLPVLLDLSSLVNLATPDRSKVAVNHGLIIGQSLGNQTAISRNQWRSRAIITIHFRRTGITWCARYTWSPARAGLGGYFRASFTPTALLAANLARISTNFAGSMHSDAESVADSSNCPRNFESGAQTRTHQTTIQGVRQAATKVWQRGYLASHLGTEKDPGHLAEEAWHRGTASVQHDRRDAAPCGQSVRRRPGAYFP
jgi:hypothetical protein